MRLINVTSLQKMNKKPVIVHFPYQFLVFYLQRLFDIFSVSCERSKRKILKQFSPIMNAENDPNVIYGGDPEEFGPIKGSCASFGELIIKDLKGGGDRTSFVSKKKT